MKKYMVGLFLVLTLYAAGCRGIGSLPLAPPPPPVPTYAPMPTGTPTVNPTPICGFTDLGVGMSWIGSSGTTSTFVIQTAAQWAADNSTQASTNPPLSISVDFNRQMVLEVSEFDYYNCGCSSVPPSITSVCFYSDHVEVDYNHAGSYCPPPPPGRIPVMCNSFFSLPLQDAVAVPQSSLPVTWIGH